MKVLVKAVLGLRIWCRWSFSGNGTIPCATDIVQRVTIEYLRKLHIAPLAIAPLGVSTVYQIPLEVELVVGFPTWLVASVPHSLRFRFCVRRAELSKVIFAAGG
jgi:hypothetical protein